MGYIKWINNIAIVRKYNFEVYDILFSFQKISYEILLILNSK